MNSLTVNLHLMMIPFYDPTPSRHRILIEKKAFPSDLVRVTGALCGARVRVRSPFCQYAVQSQINLHNYNPETSLIQIAPRPGSSYPHNNQSIPHSNLLAPDHTHG